MARTALRLAAVLSVAVVGTLARPAGAQPVEGAWTAVPSEAGAVYSDGPWRLVVLPLAEVDRLTGYDVSELGDDSAAEQLDYALSALPFERYDVTEESDAVAAGTAVTADGPRAFAAELRGTGAARALVALVAPDDNVAAARRRLAAVTDLPSAGAVARRGPAPRATDRPADRPPPHVDYPAPASFDDLSTWTKDGFFFVQRPGDPTSPRAVNAITGPDFDVYDHDAAVRDLVKDSGIDFVRTPRLEPSEAWVRVDGRDLRFTFAESRLGGEPGVVFLIVSQEAGSDQFQMFGVETTRATFEAWGGAPRMMLIRDLVPSVDVFPAERRAQIARGSLASQVALYEAALDKLFLELAASRTALSQGQLLNGMMELNYDLLFDNDIGASVLDLD